jgi:hypothetical protein
MPEGVFMGFIKGQVDYQRWKRGASLTRQESIDAQCYICNGGENMYCGGEKSCTLYRYSPFSRDAIKKRAEEAGKRRPRQISTL